MVLSHPQQAHNFDPQALANTLPVPQEWVKLPRQSIVMCQNTVHLGVKLEVRLMKPGIVLPMGTYVSSAHFELLFSAYNKDMHNLQRQDFDYKTGKPMSLSDVLLVIQFVDSCHSSLMLQLLKFTSY